MSERSTLKLKADAATRDPRRLRVRATTAPRKPKAAAPVASDDDRPRERTAPPRPAQTSRPRRDAPQGAPPQRPSAPQRKPPPPAAQPAKLTARHDAAARPRRALPPAAPVSAGALRSATLRKAAAVPARAEGIRLSKALTEQGIASRREADDWIAAGWVRVDGEMAVLGQRVRPEQRIDIDPRHARNRRAASPSC